MILSPKVPPEIVYASEYTITSEEDFGRPGQVACVVHNSPTTTTTVFWWSNSRRLENGDKYHMNSVSLDSEQGLTNTVKYQLTVNATAQGNSGGPVFDDQGLVIAIYTWGNQRLSGAVPIRYGIELMGVSPVRN